MLRRGGQVERGDCRVGWQRGLRHYESELCGRRSCVCGRRNRFLAEGLSRIGGERDEKETWVLADLSSRVRIQCRMRDADRA